MISSTSYLFGQDTESADDLLRVIHKVNRHWQENNSPQVRSFWDNAAYHTGNMEVYALTGNAAYLKYSTDWAEYNHWKGAASDNKAEWKYGYGETPQYVLFGDWQCCFQTYADLYGIRADDRKIDRAREVMEYQMGTDKQDYWWWADGLYMVMPVMTKLYKITKNPLYLEKLYEYFAYADSLMYDPEAGLYYRDGSFVYPKHAILGGKKDFWARGDGWVLAAFAKVLQDLPETDKHRRLYMDRYLAMAGALAKCQHPGGYWTRSLLQHDFAPGPETSGTAFFAYGLQWGINNGLLDGAVYQSVVDKAWKYLVTVALQPDGSVGYVQPIGGSAIPDQVLRAGSTANFGVGAFLLAACERYRYLQRESWKDVDGNYINAHGGGILPYNGRYYWFGEHRPAKGFSTQVGITCYSSDDLANWKYEGVALAVSEEEGTDIERGCIMERPKVIYNEKTGKFVLWFHLELKGRGYGPARAAVAVSDRPEGPYRFISSGRVCPGRWPMNMTEEERNATWEDEKYRKWWTPAWHEAIEEGMFVKRDWQGGQMSRDMTLFKDDDGKAYHIYSSEDNLTLQIAELTEDYLSHSGRYIRIFPAGHNEAPAIFKKDGTYWMITSGCTGWAPNAARLFSAPSIWGPWKQHPNPCRGDGSERTFGGQSTYVLQLPGNRYLFMADIWHPKSLMYSGYLWIPVRFDEKGILYLEK
ncbi:glycoside hydrolase family 88 protein [Bacteroides sp.]|uniref:glycoside hydrolase family 88 protein n=1 Tax=Bacteroides sp. TaxID=29523 RepID=UPI0034CE5897